MKSVESKIKSKYSKFFNESNSITFKNIGEYYLRTATVLKKKHISSEKQFKLLIRNIQKRLFISIECELILKSYYLKRGYCINKPIDCKRNNIIFLHEYNKINFSGFQNDETYTFYYLIDNLKKVKTCSFPKKIVKGFKNAKDLRNKEAYLAVYLHNFDPSNYDDDENCFKPFYNEDFSKK